MAALQVRNEHKVFDECPDDGSQEHQNLIHLDLVTHFVR
jgi:hypothetical protein